MLEIGSYEGRSSIWFLEKIVTHETARLFCVDPWGALSGDPAQIAVERLFDHNLAVSGFGRRLVKIRGLSQEVVRLFPVNFFDAVYIDGDHSSPAVIQDAVLALLETKPDGLIIFDDYRWNGGATELDRPKLAIDSFLNLYEGKIELLHQKYQVIVRKL